MLASADSTQPQLAVAASPQADIRTACHQTFALCGASCVYLSQAFQQDISSQASPEAKTVKRKPRTAIPASSGCDRQKSAGSDQDGRRTGKAPSPENVSNAFIWPPRSIARCKTWHSIPIIEKDAYSDGKK